MKRRDFLKQVAPMSLLPFAINGQPIRAYGKLLGSEAEAFTETDKILVLVRLSGGNDGLNTLIPLDQYTNLASARPNLLIAENKVLKLDGVSGTGLHPAMSKVRDMYNDGKVHILQSVGYPNQNYSHFRSSDIWMTGADSDKVLESGWIGRYLSEEWPNYPNGFPNADMKDPLAIQIGSVVDTVCQGLAVNMGFAISNPTNYYQLLSGNYPNPPSGWAGKELGYLRTVARQTNEYSVNIKAAAEGTTNLSTLYPNTSLANQLKIVAQLISGGLKTRVYIVSQGGYDTHSNQVDPVDGTDVGSHANLLTTLSEAIYAFQDDIEKMKVDKRVIGMTFSEFGRRIINNASSGTDHGSSAPLFMFGTSVKAGISGTNPTIPANAGPNDNLDMQTDFRSIYSTILKKWFCLDGSTADSVLLKNFSSLDLIQDNACDTSSISILRKQRAGDAYISNYPNPFGSSTTIKYYSNGGLVSVNILDVQGRLIAPLVNEVTPKGTFEVVFNTAELPMGTYYCHYQNGLTAQTRSLLKVR
jgi:uncharacterized protein (DUF1501 family)